MKRLILLMALALGLAMPAFLQDEGDCNTASLQAAIQTQLHEIDNDPIAALEEIIHLALGRIFDCSSEPPAYSGRQGSQPVLGPLNLNEGFYIFTLITDGSARVEATSLEACGKDLDGTIFNISAGESIDGAENLVQAEADCTTYLELSKISAAWTLSIKKVQ